MDYFRQGVEMLNPGLQTFSLSCTTEEKVLIHGWIGSDRPFNNAEILKFGKCEENRAIGRKMKSCPAAWTHWLEFINTRPNHEAFDIVAAFPDSALTT